MISFSEPPQSDPPVISRDVMDYWIHPWVVCSIFQGNASPGNILVVPATAQHRWWLVVLVLFCKKALTLDNWPWLDKNDIGSNPNHPLQLSEFRRDTLPVVLPSHSRWYLDPPVLWVSLLWVFLRIVGQVPIPRICVSEIVLHFGTTIPLLTNFDITII